jgi:hypothetical protein
MIGIFISVFLLYQVFMLTVIRQHRVSERSATYPNPETENNHIFRDRYNITLPWRRIEGVEV